MPRHSAVPIDRVEVAGYTIPTDLPEGDGTFRWDQTTIVIVTVTAGDQQGLGYTYANAATAHLIQDTLAEVVTGRDAMSVDAAWQAMVYEIRNLGRPGISSMAIAAVDNALWDLKARLLDLPLVTLMGQLRDRVLIYGSGGFTTYTNEQLQAQLGGWARDGIRMVKMKIGAEPERDLDRVRAAREAIGSDCALFVDANGAYSRKQALAQAGSFAELDVSWFEEPVSSDDLAGLHLMRDRAPAGMQIAAGEYGYDLPYFRRMLDAEAVDILQADATRCAGFTEFLRVGALCEAHCMPLSAHTAPALHVHVCCAAPRLQNLEYFHDHVRIEQMFFDGILTPKDGALHPDLSRPGMGLELKRADVERWRIHL